MKAIWDPEDLSLAVRYLRALRGWTQTRLAREAGVHKSRISLLEAGKELPDRAMLQRLSAAVGLPFAHLELALPVLRQQRQALGRQDPPTGAAEEMADSVEAITTAVADAIRPIATRAVLALSFRSEDSEWSYRAEDREDVEELYRFLEPCTTAQRQFLIKEGREYRSWALAEKLCDESEKAASHDLDKALEIAETALNIARVVSGPEGFRCHVEGYCWGFVGNVRRVASDFPAADQAFLKTWELWQKWKPVNKPLLQESRLLDLEASLRRDQRQLERALVLHQRAFQVSLPVDRPIILLNRSYVEKLLGHPKKGVATLRQARELLAEHGGSPRLHFCLTFNLAANLLDLGRPHEAVKLLPEVRSRAEALGNALDLLRVDWLEALAAAARGRRDEAIASLRQVRDAFARKGIAYDAALAALDLAIVLLEAGRHAEVRSVAEEMLPIFQAQKVAPEALASLQLFCEAARREAATVELARRAKQELERAGQG